MSRVERNRNNNKKLKSVSARSSSTGSRNGSSSSSTRSSAASRNGSRSSSARSSAGSSSGSSSRNGARSSAGSSSGSGSRNGARGLSSGGRAGSHSSGAHGSSSSSRAGSHSSGARRSRKSTARRRSGAKIFVGFMVRLLLWAIFAASVFAGISYGIKCVYEYTSRATYIKLTDEGFTHAKMFKDCAVVDGMDISEYQDGKFQWEKVKTSGADFVFIRAGYRTVDSGTIKPDSLFDEHMAGATAAGVMAGAYIYSQALTPAEAEEEADFLIEQVKGYDITMPLVIDYELFNGGRLQQKIAAGGLPNASDYHDIVKAFCRRVEEAGYESAIYANLDMLTHYMNAKVLDDTESIWLARFNYTPELKAGYQYWQCSETGMTGGFGGNVDHDYWYIRPNKVYETKAAGEKKKRVSIGDCEVSLRKSKYKLRSFRAEPKIRVKYDGEKLDEGTDFSVSYVNNTEAGTGYAIVRGTGGYKDWIALPFTIK